MGHYFATRRGANHRRRYISRRMVEDPKAAYCPMCGSMMRFGGIEPMSMTVDHIIPTSEDPSLEKDEDNWWIVCRDCHNGPCQSIEERHKGYPEAIETAKREYRRRRIGMDGWPV